jgi:hypothetical protein
MDKDLEAAMFEVLCDEGIDLERAEKESSALSACSTADYRGLHTEMLHAMERLRRAEDWEKQVRALHDYAQHELETARMVVDDIKARARQ